MDEVQKEATRAEPLISTSTHGESMLPKTIAGMILSLAVLLSQTAWAQLPKSAVIGTNTRVQSSTRWRRTGKSRQRSRAGSDDGPTVQEPAPFFPLLDNGGASDRDGVDMGMAYQGPQRLKIGGKNDFRTLPIPAWSCAVLPDHRIAGQRTRLEERPTSRESG